MKKALIIFIIFFIATLIIPLISIVPKKPEGKNGELVTIFSADISALGITVYPPDSCIDLN